MGLFHHDAEREFIVWPDAAKGQILYKWPDTNIRMLTQLTVEQDERAVFFRDGTVRGIIEPGRTTLSSSEIPFLGDLIDAATGGNFLKTELYFISTREFPNLPFGGMVDNVVDPDTQLAVGLRVFGDYSLKVVEPQALIVNLVGTQNLTTNDQITDWMRDQLLKVFREDVVSHISAQGWPILGIAGHNDEIEQETIGRLQPLLASYGLGIGRMGNFTISISPEDETTLKNYRKDVQYTKLAGGSFQAAAAGQAMEGIGQGAAQGGGAVGPAILGVGLGLGGQMMGQQQPAAPAAAAAPPTIQVRCPSCGVLNAEASKFCSSCGHQMQAAPVTCAKCGTASPAGTKFCPNCGTALDSPPA